MRLRALFPLAAAAMLFAPSAASADFGHVVLPGESLSSIAALDGLSVDQLAAANGLSPDAQLIAGSTLMIPPQGGGSVSSSSSTATGSSAAATTPSSAGDGDGDGDDVGASTAASGAASAGGGSYIVQPGDTLSAIAARAGTTVDQLAAANGLDPNGLLQIGAALSLPGAGSAGQSSASAAAGQPVGAPAEGSPVRLRTRPRSASRPRRLATSLRPTACRHRWRRPSGGRRAVSTTTWCRAPAPAASCRSCPAHGAGSTARSRRDRWRLRRRSRT